MYIACVYFSLIVRIIVTLVMFGLIVCLLIDTKRSLMIDQCSDYINSISVIIYNIYSFHSYFVTTKYLYWRFTVILKFQRAFFDANFIVYIFYGLQLYAQTFHCYAIALIWNILRPSCWVFKEDIQAFEVLKLSFFHRWLHTLHE